MNNGILHAEYAEDSHKRKKSPPHFLPATTVCNLQRSLKKIRFITISTQNQKGSLRTVLPPISQLFFVQTQRA